jgi:predicted RNA binding protein YcfA (HicA-like mRNA interferase family)
MTKLPSLSSKQVIKALRSAGFENAPKKGKGSHIALIKKRYGPTAIGYNSTRKNIPRGTLNVILQQAALTRDEFLSLLEGK